MQITVIVAQIQYLTKKFKFWFKLGKKLLF